MDFGERLPAMSFDEMAKHLRNGQPTSETHERVLSELQRRQTIAQIEATAAQKEASKAQIETARYALWTVLVAAVSTLISATALVVAVVR
jgi:hypothetical protein